jgi:hypothetical protein
MDATGDYTAQNLSACQRDVMKLIVRALSNKEIASILNLAEAAPKISVTLEPITSEQATNGQRLLFIPGGLQIVKVKLPARVACKSMNHAQKYLSQANRQIAELTVQHARQRVIVKHALDTGQGSEMAESLLDALEGSLRIFEKHRIFLLSYSVNRPNRRLQRQI